MLPNTELTINLNLLDSQLCVCFASLDMGNILPFYNMFLHLSIKLPEERVVLVLLQYSNNFECVGLLCIKAVKQKKKKH